MSNDENTEMTNTTPPHKGGGKKILLLIALAMFFAVPILTLAVGIGIIPRGGSFEPLKASSTIAKISGDGCSKYTGTKLTAYWTPDNWTDYGNRPEVRKMEGGPNDRKGKRNHTLFEYVAGKYIDPTNPLNQYVSVAGDVTDDSPLSTYGTKVYIPAIEQAVNGGKEIIFRVVDTGGAFKTKGTTKLDVAVMKESELNTSILNSSVDIWVGDGCRHDTLISG